MSIRVTRPSRHNAEISSGTGPPAATVTITVAARLTASWYTNAADRLSSRCASSTTSNRPSPTDSRAARSTAAVLPVSGTSMRSRNAANGTALVGAVAVTQSTRPNCDANRSAAVRANHVLPTPADPISTVPARSRTPLSSSSSAGSCGAVTHSTGTARVYDYVVGVSPELDREWAVCVYCASGPTHPELLMLAVRVGEAVAERGWTLGSGGGKVSGI